MVYSKPELDKVGMAEHVVLADAPHQGSDVEGNGAAHDWRPIQDLEFE